MEILLVVILPGYVVPLGVLDPDFRLIAHDPLGTFPWIEILPGVVGTLELDSRGHAPFGLIDA
jgi:hypothetical protein